MKVNNESGISLMEVLIAITISSLIVFALYSILYQSLSGYQSQLNKNRNLYDAAYALKVITKDIRKTTDVSVNEHSCELVVGSNVFRLDGDTLYKNSAVLVRKLQSFKVTIGQFNEVESCSNGSSNIVSIKLVTENHQTYEIELAIRKGG